MLLNLVSNAVKFSASNTRILLSVTQAGDRSIQFSVADQGIGIAAADIERILRPFEQVENAWSRSHDGVGLGLALVQSMAKAHDATLRIESAHRRRHDRHHRVPAGAPSRPARATTGSAGRGSRS